MLVSRTIDIHRALVEQGSPRAADSIFQLARMLQAKKEDVLVATLLRVFIGINSEPQEMKGQALWFLAGIEKKLDMLGNEYVQPKERARRQWEMIMASEDSDDDMGESFMAPVSWILW